MSSAAATRRGLFGAAAGAGAGYAVGGPVLGALARSREKDCLPAPPGVPAGAVAIARDGTIWVADSHSTTITARRRAGTKRGRSIDVGGAPVSIAISPDGDTALVTTARYDRPGLAIVDLRSRKVERVEVGPEPEAVVFSAGGKRAYVLGGGKRGTLRSVNPRSGKVGRVVAVGKHPRGLALTPDGKAAVVTLNGQAAVAIVELRRGRVERIKTERYPAEVAVSPNGRRALVGHSGYGDQRISVIDLGRREVERRTKVGTDPAGIAFGGSRAIVATRSGRAVVLDSHGRILRRVKLGGFPGAVDAAGGAGYVADSRSGRLHRVRIGAGR